MKTLINGDRRFRIPAAWQRLRGSRSGETRGASGAYANAPVSRNASTPEAGTPGHPLGDPAISRALNARADEIQAAFSAIEPTIKALAPRQFEADFTADAAQIPAGSAGYQRAARAFDGIVGIAPRYPASLCALCPRDLLPLDRATSRPQLGPHLRRRECGGADPALRVSCDRHHALCGWTFERRNRLHPEGSAGGGRLSQVLRRGDLRCRRVSPPLGVGRTAPLSRSKTQRRPRLPPVSSKWVCTISRAWIRVTKAVLHTAAMRCVPPPRCSSASGNGGRRWS